MEPGIRFRDVHKRYRVYRQRYRSLKSAVIHRRFGEWEDTWALRGVSFDVTPGSTLGLIGPNGAGKSTALKLMARILVPDRGRVEVGGRVGSLIELGAGFHPEYTGRENVFLNGSLLGFARGEIRRRFDDIVDFAELGRYIDDPLRTYSSGMQIRLGFSVAIHVDPEVMLLDEILAVGDEAFQRKCFEHVDRFKARGGTLVLVSHSMDLVRRVCAQTAWIEGGSVQAMGPSQEVVDAYLTRVYRGVAPPSGADGGHDQGSIELGLIRLLDQEGAPVESLETGSDLTLEIGYRSHRRVETPIFGVTIHAADGGVVYSTSSAVDGVFPDPAVAEGRALLTYHRLQLMPGRYRISVAAYDTQDPDALPVDIHVQSYSLRVVSGAGDQGVVRLDHGWSFKPAGDLDRV